MIQVTILNTKISPRLRNESHQIESANILAKFCQPMNTDSLAGFQSKKEWKMPESAG